MMPPHDIDTEHSALSCIINKRGLSQLMLLEIKDFYAVENAIMFGAMKEVYHEDITIDLISLKSKLEEKDAVGKSKMQEKIGILTTTYIPMSVENIYSRLKELSYRRQILFMSQDVQDRIVCGTEDIDEVLDTIDLSVKMIGDRNKSHLVKMQDAILQDVEDYNQTGQYITTGISSVDRKIIGFFDTQLILIGARPGIGKTALALQIAYNVSKKDPVLFVTLEMLAKQLALRTVSFETEIEINKIRAGKMTDYEKVKVNDAMNRIKEKYSNITFIEKVSDIRRIIALIKRAFELKKYRAVILDYIQLTKGGLGKARHEQISDVSGSLKSLAVDLEVPIIALSQLSRGVENGGEPSLADLRDSGSLEQDADMVMFLHSKNRNEEMVNAIVAKNRDGGVGIIKLKFHKKYYRFVGVSNEVYVDGNFTEEIQ